MSTNVNSCAKMDVAVYCNFGNLFVFCFFNYVVLNPLVPIFPIGNMCRIIFGCICKAIWNLWEKTLRDIFSHLYSTGIILSYNHFFISQWHCLSRKILQNVSEHSNISWLFLRKNGNENVKISLLFSCAFLGLPCQEFLQVWEPRGKQKHKETHSYLQHLQKKI